MSKVYLAIPYRYDPDQSFEIANFAAAYQMKLGNIVFSPISHSHHIADHLDAELRLDHEFWMKQDLPMIDWADKLVVVVIGCAGIDLIEYSRGVQEEIEYAKTLGKEIEYMPVAIFTNNKK
jgi:nucleoside 2-deoxyribosyltransferase